MVSAARNVCVYVPPDFCKYFSNCIQKFYLRLGINYKYRRLQRGCGKEAEKKEESKMFSECVISPCLIFTLSDIKTRNHKDSLDGYVTR